MSHVTGERGAQTDTLSSKETTAILAMMFSAPIVFAPIHMFDVAGPSAWVAGLLSAVVGAGVVYLWVALTASHPGRILPEFVRELLGPWLGWGVTLIYGVYFCYEVAVSSRMTAEVVRQVLPTTPMDVLIGMALVTAAVVARLGPVVLGRMAIIHLGVIAIGFLAMAIGLSPLVNLGNFLPLFTDGWGPVIRAATRPASLLGHIVLIAFFLPLMKSADHPKDGSQAQGYFQRGLTVGMTGIGFSWLCFFILLLLEQGVFTAYEASRLAMPALSAARAIDFGNPFERVEVALLAVWLPAVLIKTCIFLYIGALTVSHLTAARSYRRFVVPVAGLALPASYSLATDLPELIKLINGAWVFVAIAVKITLPLLLLGLGFLKRRVSPAS